MASIHASLSFGSHCMPVWQNERDLLQTKPLDGPQGRIRIKLLEGGGLTLLECRHVGGSRTCSMTERGHDERFGARPAFESRPQATQKITRHELAGADH